MTVSLRMYLTFTLKKNLYTIQKYKKQNSNNPTTHSSDKVYVVKDSKNDFLSFCFQYLNLVLRGHWLICIQLNHIIGPNKSSYSKLKSNWISQVSNVNILTKLQRVCLFCFPSYNVAFSGVCYLLKYKNIQIFKYYLHLKFLEGVCILKETAFLWLGSRSGVNVYRS